MAEEVTKQYPNGTLKSVRNYENGKISYEVLFLNGKTELVKEFYENGKLEKEFHYKNGKREGIQQTYYATGDLKSEWLLVAGEKIHGTYTVYYKNKQIHYSGNYRNGELEGVVKAFYENGKPEAVISYHNGKWHGDSKEYFENGSVKSQAIFENGSGLEKRFYKSGELREEMPFIDNEENGIAIGFYKSGELKYEDLYKNDQIISRKFYSKEGELKFKQSYTDSWLWGEIINKFLKDSPSKKPVIKIEYKKDGELKSKTIFINKASNIYYQELYKNNVLRAKNILWGNKKLNQKTYNEHGKLKFNKNHILPDNALWEFLVFMLAFMWIRWILKDLIKDGVKEALEDSHYTLQSIIEDSRG
ncbi:toxin-antitoxin system YwqK family antitoxin [Legionella brunensis]|nr:toxin-antitoxin system YwqK family antitoxin [Legionella brunensis]